MNVLNPNVVPAASANTEIINYSCNFKDAAVLHECGRTSENGVEGKNKNKDRQKKREYQPLHHLTHEIKELFGNWN